MSNILLSIFAFILGIGILVAFHEYGHFIVARLCGVKVLRFSIGFGRPIFRWQGKHETEYVLSILPLGGYVKMLDDRKEPPITPEERPYLFMSKSVYQRIAIVAAGPIFNLIFAVFAYWLMFMIGVKGVIPVIGEISPGSVADKIGLQPEEEIVAIDDRPTHTWQEVVMAMVSRLGEEGVMHIQTQPPAAPLKDYRFEVGKWDASEQIQDALASFGIQPKQPKMPPIVGEVISGEPSETAGFEAGDKFLAVNGAPVTSWQEVVKRIVLSANQPVTFTLQRGDQTLDLMATPRENTGPSGETIGYLGVKVAPFTFPDTMTRLQRLSPWAAWVEAWHKTEHYVVLTLQMIGKMITGQVSVSNLSGPVTIAQGAGQTASIGIQYYLGFLALISVSLGVINLLPIPVLDGGHLFFCLIELVTRRRVPEKVQVVGYQIGFTLIILLMSLAFYNDFMRFT